MSETRGALHAFNIPLIAVGHNSGYVGQRNYDNILSTAPDVQGQAQVYIFDFINKSINHSHKVSLCISPTVDTKS